MSGELTAASAAPFRWLHPDIATGLGPLIVTVLPLIGVALVALAGLCLQSKDIV